MRKWMQQVDAKVVITPNAKPDAKVDAKMDA